MSLFSPTRKDESLERATGLSCAISRMFILLLQINSTVIKTDNIGTVAENRSSLDAVLAFFWPFGDEFGTSSKLGHFGATRTFP